MGVTHKRQLCPGCDGEGYILNADWNRPKCTRCDGEGWIDVAVSPSSSVTPPVVKAPTRPHTGTMPPTQPEPVRALQVYAWNVGKSAKKIGKPVFSLQDATTVVQVYSDLHQEMYPNEPWTGDFIVVDYRNGDLSVYSAMPQCEPFWEVIS